MARRVAVFVHVCFSMVGVIAAVNILGKLWIQDLLEEYPETLGFINASLVILSCCVARSLAAEKENQVAAKPSFHGSSKEKHRGAAVAELYDAPQQGAAAAVYEEMDWPREDGRVGSHNSVRSNRHHHHRSAGLAPVQEQYACFDAEEELDCCPGPRAPDGFNTEMLTLADLQPTATAAAPSSNGDPDHSTSARPFHHHRPKSSSPYPALEVSELAASLAQTLAATPGKEESPPGDASTAASSVSGLSSSEGLGRSLRRRPRKSKWSAKQLPALMTDSEKRIFNAEELGELCTGPLVDANSNASL